MGTNMLLFAYALTRYALMLFGMGVVVYMSRN